MIHKKPLSLAAALGLAASLACASAYASSHQGGGYEERERMEEKAQKDREQKRVERRERIRKRIEQIGYDVEQIDKNQDRFVTEEEYSEWRQSLFGNLDADQNEELTVLEYIVLNPTRLEPKLLQVRFRELDQDNDGKVTKDQYIQQTEDLFEEVDRDDDGKVSNDELRDVLLGRG